MSICVKRVLCSNEGEARCSMCGDEACNLHGHWRGNEDEPFFLCEGCEQEVDKEVDEDHGPMANRDE